MRQLGVLLVIVGVGYLLYTQALPRWEEKKAAEATASAQSDQSIRCVNLAQGVVSSFSSGMRQFAAPPVDQGLWGSWFRDIGSELTRADSGCACAAKACESASAALYGLRGLLNDLDDFVTRGGTPVLDAPSRLERINRLLVSARTSSLGG